MKIVLWTKRNVLVIL